MLKFFKDISSPGLKSEFSNTPGISPINDTIACAYCYQFKILCDDQAGFYCMFRKTQRT